MSGRAIDKVIAHYAATKGKRFDIDTAWGFKIWFSPWVLGERDRIFDAGITYRPRTNARIVIVKAEDEHGNRLFADIEEGELLNEADPAEVSRVAHEIMHRLNEDNAAATDDDAATSPKA